MSDSKKKGLSSSEIDKQIEELQTKKKNLQQSIKYKSKYAYRKERANRLIQTGALVEKYFEIHNLEIDEREELFKIFAEFIKSNKPNHLKK